MALSYAAVCIILLSVVSAKEIVKSETEIPLLSYETNRVYQYRYKTITELNEPHVPYVTNNTLNFVGQLLVADIELSTYFDDGTNSILMLKIKNSALKNLAHDVKKELTAMNSAPFFIHRKEDKVREVYTRKGLNVENNNYIRGIASMFTLQSTLGRFTETDTSGNCKVRYTGLREHHMSIEKTKLNCKEDAVSDKNQALGVKVEIERMTSYLLDIEGNSTSVISAAVTSESFRNKIGLDNTIGTQVQIHQTNSPRSWQEFELISSSEKKAEVVFETFAETLESLAKDKFVGVGTASEVLEGKPEVTKPIDEILTQSRDLLTSEYVGLSTDSTEVFLDLVLAFRMENDVTVLKSILKSTKNSAILPILIDALVAAQTETTNKALFSYLTFEASTPTNERYLLSTTFVSRPREETIEFLLNLYRQKHEDQKLKELVSMTLGAAFNSFSSVHKPQHPLCAKFEEAIAQSYIMCGLDTLCRVVVIRTIANSGHRKLEPLLLKIITAESSSADLVQASVMAFSRMSGYKREVENAMFAIFANLRVRNPAPLRMLALDYILRNAIGARTVVSVLKAASCPATKEFNLMVHNRIALKAKADVTFAKYLDLAYKKINRYNYVMMIKNATGISFTGLMGETRSGSIDYNMYVHNTKGGAMIRSGLDVIASSDNKFSDIYKFGIFTEGLDSMLGDKDAPSSDVESSAGMSLDILGVALRPLRFFTGNTEMISALWNAPADLTSALQLNILIQDFVQIFRLSNGMMVHARSQGVMSLDISASLSVSLWNKNSKSLIRNSASVSLRGKIYTGKDTVGVTYKGHGKGQIDFRTNIDFAEDTKMCLQMEQPYFDFKFDLEKYEKGIKKNKKFSSKRSVNIHSEGKSLPLPRINDAMCTKMNV